MARRIEPTFEKPLRAPKRGKAKKASRAPKKRGLLARFVRFAVYWGTVLGLWGSIAVAGVFAFYAVQMPSADTWNVPARAPDMRIVAADGTFLANRGTTGGKALRLEHMSPHIPQAVIAIEDHRFHAHFGFDPIGFARAMAVNLTTGSRQGGSTLTQQLAKNLFLTPERSYGRKVQELILAFWLEAKYSKAEILEMYLNRVYFGAGATGVDAASRRYFGKPAADVTVGEAALLAGLLKAPSRYSPARNPKLANERAQTVLAAMRREGYVKPGTVDVPTERAKAFSQYGRTGPQQHAADMVAARVRKLVGDVDGDIIVTTTLDATLLDAAQAEIHAALATHRKKGKVSEGALISMTPTGAIRSLIGGRDYGASAFNRALAKRPPGSAFKSVVWLAAFERGLTPDSVMTDAPVRYGKWAPENYDREYRGPVTLRDAFAASLNTVSARLTMDAGPKRITRLAERLGGPTLTARPSIALGTGEMALMNLATLHAPFANGGRRVVPYLIAEIRNATGKVLYRHETPAAEPVISADALAAMTDIHTTVIHSGTGRAARIDRPAGGKTGTTQGLRDAVFVGYTADLVTAVWFGNDDNTPMKKVTGATLPARAWAGFMRTAHAGLPARPIPGSSFRNLAARAALPTFRPTAPVQQMASTKDRGETLRERMTRLVKARAEEAATEVAKRSIKDLLMGR